MKLVAFSDTHGYYKQFDLPHGDVGIFCGDANFGSDRQSLDFLRWYADQPVPHKIVVAGNHDKFVCQQESLFKEFAKEHNIVYLNDSSVELDGINFWGSAYTIEFFSWYFMESKEKLKKHWDLIPGDTDVVITHQPAYGILDYANYGKENTGCKHLLDTLTKRVKPKVHICGHIHESFGQHELNNTRFYNVSLLDEDYKLVHDPTTIIV